MLLKAFISLLCLSFPLYKNPYSFSIIDVISSPIIVSGKDYPKKSDPG
jgi:hypothetical protein